MAVNPSSPSVRAGEEEGRAANQQEAARYAASPLHSTFFNLFSQSHYRRVIITPVGRQKRVTFFWPSAQHSSELIFGGILNDDGMAHFFLSLVFALLLLLLKH
jgi:hypothetical protein